MSAGSSGKVVEWGIQFTLDDAELVAKVKAAKERTAALAKSIESGTYYQLQRSAMVAAKEYDALIKKSNQLILNEQRLAREAERRQKYGRLGVIYSMTERYHHEMEQRGYKPGSMSLSGGLMRVGAVGTGMLAGAAAMGGNAVTETVAGSFKMLGLTASRAMIPALMQGSKMIQDFAGWIGKLVDQYPRLAATLGTTALVMAGLGAVGGGIRAIGYMAGGVKTAGAMVGSAWAAGTGILATAGMIPPPPPTSAGKSGAKPFLPGMWTGGTAPTAQFAPPTAKFATGAAAAGGGAGLLGMGAKGVLGAAARATGYGLLAYGANEVLGNPAGKAWDWAVDNNPFVSKTVDAKGNRVNLQEQREETKKRAMGGLGLSLNSYGAADYRDAAQSAALNMTPLDAKNFEEEVKNFQIAIKEFHEVAIKMNAAAGNQTNYVPPGR